MKRIYIMFKLSIFLCILFALVIIGVVFAEGPWIMEWFALDVVKDTGDHPNGFAVDWLKDIFGEEEAWFSEINNVKGLNKLEGTHKGENFGWFLGNLKNNNDSRNLSNGIYGGKFGDMSNYVFYGLVAVTSPKEQAVVMNVAQDDELKVWINGDLVATDTSWTTGATVTRPHNVTLEKGTNIMLVKVAEGSGGDYLNVRFNVDNLEFDAEVWKLGGYSVSPMGGALSAPWGGIKAGS
jgi:hypothetical protein